MGREVAFCLKFGLHFLFQGSTHSHSPVRSDRQKSSNEGSYCRCTSTSGDFVRWESSSEGSNRRCKSVAAKALIAAANSIKTFLLRFRFDSIYTIFFRMVCAHCGSESHRTNSSNCPNYCTLCKQPGHRQKSASCEFRVCSKYGASGHSASECTPCSECGSTTHKSALSFRVLSTSAPIAKARSSRRATTETIALEGKLRCAKNAAKPATTRTNVRFVRAVHVVFEVTNYKRAICVQNMLTHHA